MKYLLRDAVDALASVLVPARCRLCQALLVTASRIPVCQRCLDSLRPLQGHFCQQCGRPMPTSWTSEASSLVCGYCRRGIYAFDLARSYGPYDERMRQVITLLKYEAVSPLGGWLAERLWEVVAREPAVGAADLVVPVPLHITRRRERGYNQAELIARPLAKRLSLPLRPKLLERILPRPEKLKLSRRERWRSVRGAYVIREATRVDRSRVLLVDDVYTTGATLDACARALRRGGASRVTGLTVARVIPDWELLAPEERAPANVTEGGR